ncbi:hypothetical protein VPH35_078696 [Triticum aestivum]
MRTSAAVNDLPPPSPQRPSSTGPADSGIHWHRRCRPNLRFPLSLVRRGLLPGPPRRHAPPTQIVGGLLPLLPPRGWPPFAVNRRRDLPHGAPATFPWRPCDLPTAPSSLLIHHVCVWPGYLQREPPAKSDSPQPAIPRASDAASPARCCPATVATLHRTLLRLLLQQSKCPPVSVRVPSPVLLRAGACASSGARI